jgi:YHS domain-containing protein
MKKDKFCKHCNQIYTNQFLCDTCGKDLIKEHLGVPITTEFSYGSELDGEIYHFCGYTCLLQFITAELKKTQPKDDRFEYGKGK